MSKRSLNLGLSLAIALASAALPAAARETDLKEVGCDGFCLVFDDRPPDTKCLSAETEGIQTSVKVERIVATTSSYQLILAASPVACTRISQFIPS